MERLCIEALTYGQEMTYVPASECMLRSEVAVLAGQGTSDAPYMVRASVTNDTRQAWQGILRFGYGLEHRKAPFFLLPGFLYGTNRGEAPLVADSKCPRLRLGEPNFPAASWWMMRADRLSHPVALLHDAGAVVGLQGGVYTPDGAQYAGFGCDLARNMVYYTLGWENAPWMFINSHTWQERAVGQEQTITLMPGETVTADLRVFDHAAQDVLALHADVKAVYDAVHEPPRMGKSVSEAVRLLASAIDQEAWLDGDDAYSGFVFDYGKGYEYRPLPSVSWTNGISVGMPMLLASHRLRDEGMRTHALRSIAKIVRHSIAPGSGVPYTTCMDGVWSNRGWWYDKQPTPGHAAYLVGQTAYSLLKAYEAERRFAGVTHEDWLAYAKTVCASADCSRNTDGEYPYIISEETGAGLCYDSMGGAWCLAASAYLARVTGDLSQVSQLLASEQHYYDAFVAKLCCYGGPLDIDKQIDSEGILAYMRAVCCLHSITGEAALLDHLRDALLYEFTFKFSYNAKVTVPPLDRGWSSCGGSVTSVCNPHIHPMSSSVVDEMLYYLNFREDAHIRSRMEDTIGWGLQTFNTYDGEYGYGKVGWMSERFCYSQGLLTERYPDGSPASTWFALMPWASSCILEGLCGNAWEYTQEKNAAE